MIEGEDNDKTYYDFLVFLINRRKTYKAKKDSVVAPEKLLWKEEDNMF